MYETVLYLAIYDAKCTIDDLIDTNKQSVIDHFLTKIQDIKIRL